MKDILEYVLKGIVDKPEKISITESKEDDITRLKIAVDKEDIGKVIGKKGKVIKSIRSLIKVASIKNKQKIFLDTVEEA